MDNKIATLKKWIQESNSAVFFGGAGVSTESGIKDFRSPDGLYNEKEWTNEHLSTESGIPDFRSVDGLYRQKFEYPPEEIISHSFYLRKPEYFFRFYREKMMPLGFEPNVTHKVLAALERKGHLSAVVTQNIDGLHQKAGSQNVFELHGSILRNYCVKCGKAHSAEFVKNADGIPICDCGGIVKPDVVLYEEQLNDGILMGAIDAITQADLLIVGGTSLTVYPAAGLINYYRGKHLVLINRDETPYDSYANLVLHESLGAVFSKIQEAL